MNQIFISFNEKYKQHAAACIASLFIYTDSDTEVVVLDTGISKSTKTKFSNWAKKENRLLKFITVSRESYYLVLKNQFTLPNNIEYYSRLLVPYFVDQKVRRVLYIDADVVCLGDLSELFHFDLNDKILGAVQDPVILDVTKGILNFKELGLDKESLYFNSGVLLIDVEKWKEGKITQKTLSISVANHDHVTYWDQYALNVALNQYWIRLPNKWNELGQVKKNYTVLKHFAGSEKPTSMYSLIADSELFLSFLEFTPFDSLWLRMPKTRIFFRKISLKITSYLDRFIFLFIYQ